MEELSTLAATLEALMDDLKVIACECNDIQHKASSLQAHSDTLCDVLEEALMRVCDIDEKLSK